MNDNTMEKLVQKLMSKYYMLYSSMPIIPLNILVTESLSKSHFNIRPELKERLIKEGIEKNDRDNGRMILPYRVGDTITILLNKQNIIKYTEDGSMTWIGTFAHELTHAIDFHLLALKEKLDIYDPLLDVDKYFVIQLWSEYHARKLGYNFLRNQLNVDKDYTEKDRIEYILNKEWPHHVDSYNKEYHETNNGNIQMNLTMQLLGRFSVWCDLFPKTFNDLALKDKFINMPWMYNIFSFLRQHNSIDSIYFHCEDMRLILKENWGGL